MNKKQTTSLEQLYKTFAGYSPERLEAFLCEHDEKYMEMLRTKPRGDLTRNDLDYFSGSWTLKDLNAFKYFLPVLFEFFPFYIRELRQKLEQAKWKESWPEVEINAVERHILYKWQSIQYNYYFEDYLAFFSFSKLLSLWKTNPDFLKNTVELWESDNRFFKDYWSPTKRNISEEDKSSICDFLKGESLRHLESDSLYAQSISKINDYFDWCESSKPKQTKEK